MTDKYCTCGHKSGTFPKARDMVSGLPTIETCEDCQLPVRLNTDERDVKGLLLEIWEVVNWLKEQHNKPCICQDSYQSLPRSPEDCP